MNRRDFLIGSAASVGIPLTGLSRPINSLVASTGEKTATGGGDEPLSAKSYIQDGLVAMWDGIENAGWGTHDPNAMTWVDLISGKVIQLVNGIIWMDNGLDTNFKTISKNSGSTSVPVIFKAIEIVFRNKTPGAEFSCLIRNSDTDGGCGGFIVQIGTLKPLWEYGNHFNVFSVSDDIHSCNVTQTGVGEVRYLTYDGKSYSYTGSGVYRPPFDYRLGNWSYNGSGNIYNIRLYSRALTADEIAANYAVDKARFNLP